MMRARWVAAVALAWVMAAAGCQRDRVQVTWEAGVNPWTSLQLNNDPGEFQFGIISDRTGKHREGVFESAIEKMNLLEPEFVMTTGDLIEGYTEDPRELTKEWDEIEGMVGRLKMPFFYVPGNHDLSNPVQRKEWVRRFGREYYHFVYRDVLFLCVSSEDPAANMSAEQVAYFARALAENQNVRWTLVFLHEPLWNYKKADGWQAFEKLLVGRKHTVFAGHTHIYTKYVRNDSRYIVLATAGGGSQLLGPLQGSFDHVTWVTMKKDGPEVAVVELKGIHDENVRTESTALLVDPVLRGAVLRMDPVFVDGAAFDGGKGLVRVANPSTAPLKVKGKFRPHSQMTVEPAEIDVAVPPGETREIEISVKAVKPLAAGILTPMMLDWDATYELKGEPAFMIGRATVMAPTQRYACASRSEAVTVDGELKEWGELEHEVISPGGAADGSYRFTVKHDEQYVYVAVRVKDDVSYLNPKVMPWAQDGIELRLDARAEPERSLGRGMREMKDTLVVSMSPEPGGGDATIYEAAQIPAGVKYACKRTADGFAAEVAIPVSYLNGKQGKEWEAFRLNIVVNDVEKEDETAKRAWWKPDWRDEESVSGSGTFLRK